MSACCHSCSVGGPCETDSVGTVLVWQGKHVLKRQGCYPLWNTLPEGVQVFPSQMRGYLMALGGIGFPPRVAKIAGDVALDFANRGYGNMTPDFLSLVAAWKVSVGGRRFCGNDPSAVQYVAWMRARENQASRMAYDFLREVHRRTLSPWIAQAILVQGNPGRRPGVRVMGYQGLAGGVYLLRLSA